MSKTPPANWRSRLVKLDADEIVDYLIAEQEQQLKEKSHLMRLKLFLKKLKNSLKYARVLEWKEIQLSTRYRTF
ncbi:MAG: hypothetical protein ABH829_05185 [archaeon]